MGITRLVRYAAPITAALITSPALGQTTNTNCYPIGNTIQCRSQTQPGINWGIINQQRQEQLLNPMNAYQQGVEARRQREALEAQIAASRLAQQEASSRQAAEEQQRQLGREAGKLAAAGKCGEAETLALEAGNFDLAKTVKEYCAGR